MNAAYNQCKISCTVAHRSQEEAKKKKKTPKKRRKRGADAGGNEEQRMLTFEYKKFIFGAGLKGRAAFVQ